MVIHQTGLQVKQNEKFYYKGSSSKAKRTKSDSLLRHLLTLDKQKHKVK